VSACVPNATDTCGNGTIDPGEDCDLGDLNGDTCADQGLFGEGLACGAGCVFNTSGCSATRYENCGDGTVADHLTGLMWQQTDDAGGLTDTYTWSTGSDEPSGTAFTVFLCGLNDCETGDGAPVTGGYAGHCDWRMPRIDELATIVDCAFGSPCIDESVFGLTASSYYWSASTDYNFPDHAWSVNFNVGYVYGVSKVNSNPVRAVRSGSCP
jgi:hypothetical protein